MNTVSPFTVAVSQQSLDDLKDRLDRTRWTSDIPGSGADYGTSLGLVQRLVEYWRNGYDWRSFEARLNDYPTAAGVPSAPPPPGSSSCAA